MKKGRPNPFVATGKSEIGNAGRHSERRVSLTLGANLTPASGAVQGFKSDMILPDYRIEAKSTQANSITIKLEYLVKITEESLNSNKVPALTVSFTDAVGKPKRFGDWVMIPISHYEEIVELYKERGGK